MIFLPKMYRARNMVTMTAWLIVVRDFSIITRRVVRNFQEVLIVVPHVQLNLYLVCIDDDKAKQAEERLKWREFVTQGVMQ